MEQKSTLPTDRRTLYEERPDEFVLPNGRGGVKVFRRDKTAEGVVRYWAELTREELLRDS